MAQNDEETIQQMAKTPDVVWAALAKMTGVSDKVDTMLLAGWSPEKICLRSPFLEMPVGIQTAILNALHYRQSQLRAGRDG